jgi:hypothetical protein
MDYKLWVIGFLALLLASCEVIGENERLIALPLPEDTTGRKHVLIEYTGFRCVNCPKAAEAAEVLKETYGERLIVVSMHPASNPFTQGKYDYTCNAADVYYQYMGGTATTPFPTGNVDFEPSEKGFLHDFSEWPTLVAQQMVLPAQGKIIRRLTWLVEDSVPGVQAMPDGSVNTQYYHRHMLRGAIGEPRGEETSDYTLPDTLPQPLTLPENCNLEHCAIVYVLMDENNIIVNAKEVKL